MCQASSQIRRSFALTSKLITGLGRWCRPSRPTRPSEQKKTSHFEPKLCQKLGVCICHNKDLLHFATNLKDIMKHVFWNKPKFKTMSTARKLLEKKLIILEFQMKPDFVDTLDGNEAQHETSCFFHIGRINYSTWRFGAMRLYVSELQSSINGALLDMVKLVTSFWLWSGPKPSSYSSSPGPRPRP